MKYESSILKRLIDTYGVVGNPRYLSEIIKEFIVRGKELYPQLFTYQSDWLAHIDEFGLTPEYTVSYTGQQIYAPHTKEKPVKSANLKGNTLVNLLANNNVEITSSLSSKIEYVYQLDTTKTYIIRYRVNQLPELSASGDTARAFKFEWYNGSIVGGYANINTNNVVIGKNEYIKIEPYSGEISRTSFGLWCPNYVSGTLNIDIMLIEYQDGMENWDIPYFEGMQSVKMPVLKTTGKNLFDMVDFANTLSQISPNVEIIDNNTLQITTTNLYRDIKYRPIKFKQNTQYVFQLYGETIEGRDRLANYISIVYTDGTKVNHNKLGLNVLVTDKEKTVDYIGVSYGVQGVTETISNISLVEGISTEFEPYKSNILTVNEEVVLRGISDVQDTLDLMTGELTERVGEVVYDGSDDENWDVAYINVDGLIGIATNIPSDMKYLGANRIDGFINDRLKQAVSENMSIYSGYGGWRMFAIYMDSSTFDSAQKIKQWLSQNPITVQYELDTESIKTVDLTIHDKDHQKVERLTSFEGGTHFTTTSQDGSLLPTLTVDVVTDLEEILMVCSSEGNTM